MITKKNYKKYFSIETFKKYNDILSMINLHHDLLDINLMDKIKFKNHDNLKELEKKYILENNLIELDEIYKFNDLKIKAYIKAINTKMLEYEFIVNKIDLDLISYDYINKIYYNIKILDIIKFDDKLQEKYKIFNDNISLKENIEIIFKQYPKIIELINKSF